MRNDLQNTAKIAAPLMIGTGHTKAREKIQIDQTLDTLTTAGLLRWDETFETLEVKFWNGSICYMIMLN